MNLMNFFLNSVGRIRSGWRFLIFVLVFGIVSTVLSLGLILIFSKFSVDETTRTILFFIFGNLLSFVCAIFVGWLCGKFLEDLPFRAIGCWFTKKWFKDLVLGLVIGTLSILLAALISMVFGGLSFQLNQTANSTAVLTTLAISLTVFIMGAASEEAVYRGYILQTFSRAKLIWFGILLTSLPFALGHANNPDVSIFALINTALAGIWFGVAYLKTRNLWFPFGLHLMWNWVQGAFLGIPVSGIRAITPNPILQAIDIGPTWLTGGHYGLEAGFACTVALIFSTLLIWFLPILKPTDEMLALTNEENPKADFLA
jgi:uncharacterized protein